MNKIYTTLFDNVVKLQDKGMCEGITVLSVHFSFFNDIIRLEDCVELLCNTGRYPEAAFMARTYLPSHVSRYVLVKGFINEH